MDAQVGTVLDLIDFDNPDSEKAHAFKTDADPSRPPHRPRSPHWQNLPHGLRRPRPRPPKPAMVLTFGQNACTLQNAANLRLLENDGHPRWLLVPNGIGYVFVNQTTGRALDDPASSRDSGTGTYAYGGGLNQISPP